MAVHLSWSTAAEIDLRELVAYIGVDDPLAATEFVASLLEKIDLLPDFPQMGRVVPEAKEPMLREIIHRSYRIIYRFVAANSEVEIVRLWHGARGEPELR